MKISKWLIGGIVSAQLLCSCSTVRISEYSNYKDSQFVFGPDKNAVLIVNDNVLVSEFIKTFNKKYSQKKDFIQQYADSCIVGLKKGGVFGDIKYGNIINLMV